MRAVIWKNTWLPRSETFIRDQVAEYRRTDAITFGLTRQPHPLTEPDLALLRRPRLLSAANRVLTRRPQLDRLLGQAAGVRLAHLNPDFVHAHFGVDGMTALGAIDVLRRPLFVTFHGYDAAATRRPGLTRYFDALPALFARSAGLIAVSTFVADLLKAMGAPTDRIHVHHIGVKLPTRETLADSDDGSVLFVGRMVPKKGVDVLLRAFALLAPEFRDTPLTVVGDGPMRAAFEQLARQLNVDARFAGRLPSDQVAAHIRNAALLCAPSERAPDGDSEGLPIVVLEAGAWGVPVVVADHAGIRDAVADGVSGVIFPEGDEVALAAALTELLRDRSGRRALGAAGRALIEQRFDVVTQTALLEEMYAALVR